MSVKGRLGEEEAACAELLQTAWGKAKARLGLANGNSRHVGPLHEGLCAVQL